MVFLHHVCFASVPREGFGAGIRSVYRVSQFGSAGVDVFFVLSGFLITFLLIQDRDSKTFLHDFYWKRVLRVLPLYLICLLVMYVSAAGSGPYILLCLLFIGNFAHIFHLVPLGTFWTLAIEEQFYALWPAVLRRRSVSSIERWAIAITVSAIALRTGFALAGHHDYAFTFLHCDGLSVGALLACWHWRRLNSGAAAQAAEFRIDTRGLGAIALFGFGLAAASTLLEARLLSPHAIALNADLYQTGLTLLFAGSIGLVIACRGRRSVALFRSSALTALGLISYAFYMTHGFVMEAYDHLRGQLRAGNVAAYWTRFLILFCVSIAVSLLSRYVVELPSMSLRRYLLTRSAPPAEIEQPLIQPT